MLEYAIGNYVSLQLVTGELREAKVTVDEYAGIISYTTILVGWRH